MEGDISAARVGGGAEKCACAFVSAGGGVALSYPRDLARVAQGADLTAGELIKIPILSGFWPRISQACAPLKVAFCAFSAHDIDMHRTVHKRVYSCWIVVEPAEDIAGQWVSHCLNFDIISQGATAKEAADSVCEAVAASIVDDLTKQLDPLERGTTTPPEDWERLDKILKAGTPVKMSEVSANAKLCLAKQVNFAVEVVEVKIPVTPGNVEIEPVSVAPMELHTQTFSTQQLCA